MEAGAAGLKEFSDAMFKGLGDSITARCSFFALLRFAVRGLSTGRGRGRGCRAWRARGLVKTSGAVTLFVAMCVAVVLLSMTEIRKV
jgi:hypothetical protein